MKRILICILFSLSFIAKAQQTPQYTQYTLNKYGYSPAAAGSALKNPLEILIGSRRQWLDINNSPRTNFLALNYTFVPKRAYRKWHSVGLYVDQDQSGVYLNNSFLASYTFHLVLSRKLIAAFGVYAGVRRFFVTVSSLNINDPAVAKSASNLFAYPDVIPGFRLYNKNFFFDVSIKQISIPRVANGSQQIGLSSRLSPTLYATIGRTFYLDNRFSLVPSLNMHSPFTFLPSLEGTLMLNYGSYGGIGAFVRGNSFAGGILQFRFFKNAIVGIAYDYSINKMRVAAPNSLEFMLGFVPVGADEKRGKTNNIAKCPALAF